MVQLLNSNGDELKETVFYAWPGGYPVYYISSDEEILCPTCADKAYRNSKSLDDQHIIDIDRSYTAAVHYEGADIICDECNAGIESAYGDPDEVNRINNRDN